MLRLARIIMSLLGAAAAPALAAGIAGYWLMDGTTAIGGFSLAQATLSLVFSHALVHATWIGIPLFHVLIRRGRLTVKWLTLCSLGIGFLLVNAYFVALYSPTILGAWLEAPVFCLLYVLPYVLLAPLGALTALFVWRTFPLQNERFVPV